jgi:hybrid cluster-associated redox disulfide protein
VITKDMTIAEVLRLNPDTVPVFLRYGMHCLGCPTATGESLADAAAVHGIDLEKMLRDLNEVGKE